MMTMDVITIIHCDECEREGPEQIAKTSMVNRVRMMAKEDGWKTSIKNGRKVDICPDCQTGTPLTEIDPFAKTIYTRVA